MHIYDAHLKSETPYAQGRHHEAPKLEREQAGPYNKRTYLEQLHVEEGDIYIPPMALKFCLKDTAQYLGMQVPGKGKATYTKNFRQGIICPTPIRLGLAPTDTRLVAIFTSLEPNKVKSGRGYRHFPVIDKWEAHAEIVVVDDLITMDVLKTHLTIGGKITGLGVWRPQNGGMWGQFSLVSLVVKEM